MAKNRLPRGLRKYVRAQKARIRREVLDTGERRRKIAELQQRFLKKSPVQAPAQQEEEPALANVNVSA